MISIVDQVRKALLRRTWDVTPEGYKEVGTADYQCDVEEVDNDGRKFGLLGPMGDVLTSIAYGIAKEAKREGVKKIVVSSVKPISSEYGDGFFANVSFSTPPS